MGRLDGHVAIVTGAAQGIGAQYAKAIAGEGAKVCVSDILDPAATVETIAASGGEAIGTVTDVSSQDDCQAMVAKTVETFGKLDILVTNAAMFASLDRRSFLEIGNDEWDKVIDVNVTGVFKTVKAAIPEMRKNGWGKIVNISSSTIHNGVPLFLHYVSSKGAIDAFTRALAREVGDDNIGVNCIAPGLTFSDQIEEKRDELEFVRQLSLNARAFKRDQFPKDLLGTLLFLCSHDSDFMTGQSIVVDGGFVMH